MQMFINMGTRMLLLPPIVRCWISCMLWIITSMTSPRTEATAAALLIMHIGPVLDAIKSVITSESSLLVRELRGCCHRSVAPLICSVAKFVPGSGTITNHYIDGRPENDTATPTSTAQGRRGLISRGDVKAVLERLGMVRRPPSSSSDDEDDEEEEKREEGTAEDDALEAMLEEKQASVEELREAFYVFDKNEDGFITPGELWCVMRRLGLQEGVRLEDCERMIRAYDEDGDGRISFEEFRALMENAT